jgi:hypothetical protein
VEKEMSKVATVAAGEKLTIPRGWVIVGLALASWALVAGAVQAMSSIAALFG